MSCASATVAPSGRQVAISRSTTGSSALSWSAQVGRPGVASTSVMVVLLWVGGAGAGRGGRRPSGLELDAEVVGVEGVVGAQTGGAQAELLRGVVVRAVGPRAVGLL